jgi:hypothetical protein
MAPVLPLLVFIVTLMAVPLSRVNPRQGRFLKLLPAILLYMAYLTMLIAARGALEKGKIPVAGPVVGACHLPDHRPGPALLGTPALEDGESPQRAGGGPWLSSTATSVAACSWRSWRCWESSWAGNAVCLHR